MNTNLNSFNLSELTPKESELIIGGDKFTYDIGNSIGRIGRWFSNISYPSGSYANVMSIRAI